MATPPLPPPISGLSPFLAKFLVPLRWLNFLKVLPPLPPLIRAGGGSNYASPIKIPSWHLHERFFIKDITMHFYNNSTSLIWIQRVGPRRTTNGPLKTSQSSLQWEIKKLDQKADQKYKKKTSMTNCVKSFWFIKCSNSNSSRHDKNPKNSAANVRISEVREDLKQFCKVRTKTRFLQVIIKQILYRLSSPYYSLDVSLQQLGKQDSFEHILKKSAMCDNSDSQFSRTTTGIQTGPDASKKSKAIVNCLMIKLSRAINCHYLFIFCMLIMYPAQC